MSKEPTKAELAKLVQSLQRKVTKLEKQISDAAKPDNKPPRPLDTQSPVSLATADAPTYRRPKPHVTPLPANAYGPFPWEPKQ